MKRPRPNCITFEPPLLLRNNLGSNGKTFQDVSANSGAVFTERWAGRGLAVGDINNDGRVDAVITTNGGQAHLLQNETSTANHWLLLKLVGHKSNRDGIGAVASVTSSNGTQYATVTTAGSYLSSSDKRAHFGLGQDSVVKHVDIRWPSGVIQRVQDVKADQVLTIEEDAMSTRHTIRHTHLCAVLIAASAACPILMTNHSADAAGAPPWWPHRRLQTPAAAQRSSIGP